MTKIIERDHQKLMDEVYDFWRNNNCKDRNEALSNFSELHKVAVMMGNFNYQVGNGGFSQWSFNGYDEDLYELIKICDKGISFGLNDFQQMKELLVKFSEIEEPETWSENERCHYCCGSGTVEGYDEEGDETEEECDECGGDGTFEEEYNNHDDIQSEMEELNDPYYAIETMEQSMQELLNRL